MRSRVELFEQIRRDRVGDGLSTRALAAKYGVHRRTVRQALESAVPPPRKRAEGRPAPALGAYRALIDGWLEADRGVPRKQRHTARRVWRRLVDEHGALVAERTVREYVAARRRELGEPGQVFVSQIHQAGMEAEVDWGEAQVVLAGRPTIVQLFYLRPCFSGAEFCMAFRRCTQQAFLEGHVEAFAWFGGVFALIRYDNLSRRSSWCCADADGTRQTGSSRCARTTCSTRRSRSPGLRARTRRAVWRAKWAGSGEIIWCRFRRSRTWPSSTHDPRRLRDRPSPHDHRPR